MSAPSRPPFRLPQVFALLQGAYLAFMQDNAPRLAAALAYYAFTAIAPLLFLVTVVAGYFISQKQVQTQLFKALSDSVGPKVADFVQTLLPSAQSTSLTWASVIGAVTVFLTATGLFVQLQGSLNTLWGALPVPETPPTLLQNIWLLIKTRLIAFALVVLFGGLIIAFLVGNTVLAAVSQQIGNLIGFGAFFVRVGTFLLSTLLFTLVFAFIYKFLPSVKLQWREVWVGAAITAALFTLGQVLIGLYFGRIAGSSTYGAAGALFLMLLWIYYSSMIVFFGAEVTWVFSQQYGTRAGGAANLEKKAAVAEQGVQIDTSVSESEAQAIGQTPPEAIGPAQRQGLVGRGLAHLLPGRARTDTQPPAPAQVQVRSAQAGPPTLRAALGNAALAILAVPSVALLRLLWLLRGRR
ncbi:YhjD/YihY/BrkB family envelope integrity protein [Deinococcus radiomollis]|uniref:YihY/virulence factor BrkB family protein n=1 Tax=Deinococcus radiomollis TaxID=468916 RepID=UPI0038929581